MFVNDKEMNITKSNTIKKFTGISSIKDFLQLGLPIRNISFNGVTEDLPTILSFLEKRKEMHKLNVLENIDNL